MTGDDAEIRNLLASLAHEADSGDAADYAALFTEDALWEMPSNPLAGVAADTRRGRDDILAGVHARRQAGVQGPGSHTLHMVTTVRVSIDRDVATADSCWMFFADTATMPVIRGVGRYDDRLQRTPDGWKVSQRIVLTG
jgi:3-phenylpropionate/cinnamic acid dioxygenase small subunit